MTPATVDAYLGGLAVDRRERLAAVRAVILEASPEAEETIAYGIPTYRLQGRMLVSIAAFTRHDSLFPASREVREALGADVAPYVRGRGTFQFQLRDPLPMELIGRIVRARIAEVARPSRP